MRTHARQNRLHRERGHHRPCVLRSFLAAILIVGFLPAQPEEVIEGRPNSDLGSVLLVHDLDGDDKAEIITSAPRYSDGRRQSIGMLMVVRGGVEKDREERIAAWTGPNGGAFGSSVALGDVNGDGHPDLLIGAPGTARFTGSCHVIMGGKRGGEILAGGEFKDLTATLTGDISSGHFGTAVALGDLDGDGLADLIISQPKVTVGTTRNSGRVLVFRGRKRFPAETLQVGDGKKKTLAPDLVIVGREDEALGIRLLAADLDGDGLEDLVIGSPYFMGEAGAVVVIRGAKGLLEKPRRLVLDKDDVDLVVRGHKNGRLGERLAALDLDKDGSLELLISEPLRDHRKTKQAGAIHALRWDRSRKRVDLGRTRELKGLTTLRGAVEHERLGGGLGVGAVGGAPGFDLLVASPDVGRVIWLIDPQPFEARQRPNGYKMAPGAGEKHFGATVAAGDLDGSGTPRLVVGAPGSSKLFIYAIK